MRAVHTSLKKKFRQERMSSFEREYSCVGEPEESGTRITLDTVEGVTLEDAPAIFPEWMFEALLGRED
jgi:hypothetical protein